MLNRRLLPAVLLLSIAIHSADAQEYKPEVAAASNAAELALQGFVLPEGMSGELLAAEPALANPVAFHIANDGRVYVCETFRQEVGVEDNRNHMNWLNNDLRLQSVEERLAMFKQYLGDDVQEYAIQHDRIRLLQDTNLDGQFDKDTVFAEGFNDILDGTGAGVIEVDGNVYYTCIPKLWSLTDTDGDSVADRTAVLHHGYGVRVAFRGHDMHGLTLGPDGRLYFSIGDRGYNVITQEGVRLKRVDTGAVFRCDLDGKNLEVFAYGLRNPQELAFDDDGNLWTGDNNSDGGDKARWVYVVQDGDTGWRMHFQYLSDRGPWSRERMWYPYRADQETAAVQPAYIVPPVAHLGDGPSGLTYYPGLGLSDRYANHFFMADFRGQAGNSGIRSFSVTPKGATFELTDSHEFIWSILGTDVDFAPDGSLYVTDWVNGWVGEGKGRLYRFFDHQHISAVAGANVPELLKHGVATAEPSELIDLLAHADRRVRQMAQRELAGRDGLRDLLLERAMNDGDKRQQRHLLWALWQIGLTEAGDAREIVMAFSKRIDGSGDVAQQCTRIMADLIARHGVSAMMPSEQRSQVAVRLMKIIGRGDQRHAGFAAVALGWIGRSADIKVLLDLLERNNNDDPVLRHQAVMGLVRIARRDPDVLAPVHLAERSPAVRLAAVVALRRLKREELVAMLEDRDPAVAAEAARAVLEFGSDVALNKLAFPLLLAHNHPQGISNPVIVRRALEAAYRLGSQRHALVVARVAGDSNRPEDLRSVAINLLKTWNTPQQTDSVDGRWRPLPNRDVAGLAEAVQGDLAGMLAGPQVVQDGAVKLAAALGIDDVIPTLKDLLSKKDAPETTRVEAFRALSSLLPDSESLLQQGRNDDSEAIRMVALELVTRRAPAEAVAALDEVLRSGSITAQQRAIELLSEVNSEEADTVLRTAFGELGKSVPAAVTLDLLTAADTSNDSQLRTQADAFRANQREIGTVVGTWNECLEGGNAARGRDIFFGRAAASCRRCHKVNGDGADVGPDLSAVAKDKDRRYLLEAIVDPNAKIAKGFETTIIVDFDGRIHSGIIKEETAEIVKLMTPKGAIISVAKDEIDERAKGQSGMPSDIAKNMTRAEVRDLVEYLATLKVARAGSHGEATAE